MVRITRIRGTAHQVNEKIPGPRARRRCCWRSGDGGELSPATRSTITASSYRTNESRTASATRGTSAVTSRPVATGRRRRGGGRGDRGRSSPAPGRRRFRATSGGRDFDFGARSAPERRSHLFASERLRRVRLGPPRAAGTSACPRATDLKGNGGPGQQRGLSPTVPTATARRPVPPETAMLLVGPTGRFAELGTGRRRGSRRDSRLRAGVGRPRKTPPEAQAGPG